MSIFGSIGKGFSITASSMPLVLTLFAFGFIWSLINLPFIDPSGAAQPTVITAVLGVLFILVSIFVQAGSLGYVHEVTKQGKASFGTFIQAGTKNYLRLLGLGIIVSLVMLIFVVLAVLGFVAGGNQAQPSPVAIALAVVLAVIASVTLLFLFFAPYGVVVDGKGVIASLKTSAGFVKKNFLKVLAVGVTLVILGFLIGFLLGLVMGLLASTLQGRAGQIFGSLVSSSINAFLGVLTTGAFMALYLSANDSSTNLPERTSA